MELNGVGNYDKDTLINEVSQGLDLAKQLKAQMSFEIQAGETKGMLAERIVLCLQKAMVLLNWDGSMEQSHHQHVVPLATMPSSPLSAIGSSLSEDFNPQQEGRDLSRKRKMMATRIDHVKVSSADATEGAPEDGYSWRKYGQKDILGAKYPRSYYRCTYRSTQGCCATKQVQRNDEDSMLFDITYKGTHTCTLLPRSKSAPTSPQKQECNKQDNFSITQYQQRPDMLLNFQTGLRVDVQNLENEETGFNFPKSESGYGNGAMTPSTLGNSHLYNSCPTLFMPSPATSESTYFSTSPMSTYLGAHYGHHCESEITDIISAATSGTNSPVLGIDFHLPLNHWDVNLSFPSDDSQAFNSSINEKI